jgi:uncharacterized LabA/DUF88 family protein
MALCIYRDVSKGACQQAIICTNDSDISPALEMVKSDHPQTILGLILPIKAEGAYMRRTSGKLSKLADWTIENISQESLSQSQLPDRVKTHKKPIIKPQIWLVE